MPKINPKVVLILLSLLVVYFTFRLPNLTSQPIFADEAIYVRWAQVMKNEPTLRFLPLSDGKTPLYMWILMPTFKLIEDPLYAGRFLSIVAGLFTLSGVFYLGFRFFSLRIGLWAAFLYVMTPYFVFFDRMALVDSMLAAFSIWSTVLALTLIKLPRLDLAMILGYVLGGSLLTKTPGLFNFIVLPITALTFNFKEKNRPKRILKTFLLFLVAVGIGQVMYNLLRLGPGFTSLNSRNQDYIFSPLELIGRPLDPFIPHFWDIADWFPKLLGPVELVFLLMGVMLIFQKKHIYGITIFLMSLVPLLIEMALLKTFTARYILFPIPALLTIMAFGIDYINEKLSRKIKSGSLILMVCLFIVWPLYFNFLLITDIQKAPLPRAERSGYLEEWTAGYYFKEIAQFFEEESKKQPIVVGTEGRFGTLPDGLQIYLDKNRRVSFVGGDAVVSGDLRNAAIKNPTFFVANKSRYFNYQQNLELLKEYPKAISEKGTQDAILVFKVLPVASDSAEMKQ